MSEDSDNQRMDSMDASGDVRSPHDRRDFYKDLDVMTEGIAQIKDEELRQIMATTWAILKPVVVAHITGPSGERSAARKGINDLPCNVCKAAPGEPCDFVGHIDEMRPEAVGAHDRLTYTFYGLIRDHLPAGVLFSLIKESQGIGAKHPYEIGHVEGLARALTFMLATKE